ncbi:hypothetical protein ANN_00556 [Periplaneta americana]|uniref:Uncharacterized protein n=1 Tax=Periplaneta americana TaxID=6978 RepID=A0ABQ8TV46_PERAM|nr:hypothetical protein ANN_00556 [Periplaneta americana]
MAGLCEGGNEPVCSLKAICNVTTKVPRSHTVRIFSLRSFERRGLRPPFSKDLDELVQRIMRAMFSMWYRRKQVLDELDILLGVCHQREKKELVELLAEKKLPTGGCIGRNGEREKSSGQKKISDDRRR